MPQSITLILESPITLIAARIVVTSFFWMAGIFGLFNFQVIVQEMKDASLPAPVPFAAATIACQLLSSALLITNWNNWGWLGAGALIVFTLLCIPLGHPFWKFEEPRRTSEFHLVLEHITVVGGLMLAGILALK